MTLRFSAMGRAVVAGTVLGAVLVGCHLNDTANSVAPGPTETVETKLVADVSSSGANTIDPNLLNPWGMAFGSTGQLWVADNGSGLSTVYDSAGVVGTPVVSIPPAAGGTSGTPTGVALNSTTDFAIPGFGPAVFLYAGEDGTISAWNSSAARAVLVADRSTSNAVYKGIAIALNGGSNSLYLTNFKNNSIDVFNTAFQYMTSFTDATIPAGYGPFGIENIGGELFVTFAKQLGPDNRDDDPGAGNGYVDVFYANGALARRFASNGKLNSPWGIAVAPIGFGTVAGDILIGNFGDGTIGAYDQTTGAFASDLEDANGVPLAIDGLWGLTFGPTASSMALYFSSGPNEESHGLVGMLTLK